MNIVHSETGSTVTLALDGRLTNDSVEPFERFLSEVSNDVGRLVLDLENLTFISSAGFRLIIAAHRRFPGRLVLKRLNRNVYQAFQTTGLTEVLTIE